MRFAFFFSFLNKYEFFLFFSVVVVNNKNAVDVVVDNDSATAAITSKVDNLDNGSSFSYC